MRQRTRIRILLPVVAVLVFLGCASGQTMSKPFVFREAAMPKGFPEPGPVGEVVIKDYPAYRLARVVSGRNGIPAGSGGMFRPLFNHIKRNDIPMTAPVEIGYPAQAAKRPSHKPSAKDISAAESMAFLYANPSRGQTGADPSDQRVVVEDVPAMTVVSIGVRGRYTDASFAEALDRLRAWVADNPGKVRIVGPPRYLGYNSPFMLSFLRYAEVQLPVERLEPPPATAKAQ